MAIEFYNIRSGERRTVTTEPMIAAYYNSGDQHVNALVGQDFGWRLGPETKKQLKDIKGNAQKMGEIAIHFQLPMDAIGDTDILRWISLQDAKNQQQQDDSSADHERAYQEELQALEASEPGINDEDLPAPVVDDKIEVPKKATKKED